MPPTISKINKPPEKPSSTGFFFLDNLRLHNKFILMLLFPVMGMLFFSITGILEKNQLAKQALVTQKLVQFAVLSSALVHEVQIERGMTAGYLGSIGQKFSIELPNHRKIATDAKLAELKKFMVTFDIADFGDDFFTRRSFATTLLGQLDVVRQRVDSHTISGPDAIAYYTQVNTALLDSLGYIGKLANNATIANSSNAYINFLQGKERVGIERAIITNTFAKQSFTAGMYRNFIIKITEQDIFFKEFRNRGSAKHVAYYDEIMKSRDVVEVQRMRQIALDKGSLGNNGEIKEFGIDSNYWFSTVTRKIGLLQKLEDLLNRDLAQLAIKLEKEALYTLILYICLSALSILAAVFFAIRVTRSIAGPIVKLSGALTMVGEGNLDQRIDIYGQHEISKLADGFNGMIDKLQISDRETTTNNWLLEGAKILNDEIQGDLSITELSQKVVSFLSGYIEANIGAFYCVKDNKIFLVGSYAFHARKGFKNEFLFGEGMVGQAALEKKPFLLTHVPDDYMAIGSGIGDTAPNVILVTPLLWNNEVIGLLEFGSTKNFSNLHERLIAMVSTAIATAIQTALSRDQTLELLEKTQTQAEELQVREEELRDNNTQLERQALDLQKSQTELEERNEQLQVQQEELRVTNVELEQKAQDLDRSRNQLEDKNQDLEDIKIELERRADELVISGKYKSEFLANMSHELRTPLNSMLILSSLLADNKEGNLTTKQIEFSRTIHDSGSELLTLINNILDLSKIESGMVEIHIETIHLDDFIAGLQSKFSPLAADGEIIFTIDKSQAPDKLRSDGQKLGQIVKNFLSNAIKFTNQGKVSLRVGPAPRDIKFNTQGLTFENTVAFSVIDSGIGIADDKLNTIFEAFQQADGSTSRKYGGTGLGLSISKELSRLLGGEIVVTSEVGKGSEFTLYIPKELENQQAKMSETPAPEPKPEKASKGVVDKLNDKNTVKPAYTAKKPATSIVEDTIDVKVGDRSILIIEDDGKFAKIIADVAQERGFAVLVAADGETGLHYADLYQPSGIILDIGLPGIDGLKVMEHLKDDPKTRHIPIHFISANDGSMDAMRKGAVGFLTKPVNMDSIESAFSRIESIIDRSVKRLLLVEDDPIQIKSLQELIGNGDVETVVAKTGVEAQSLMSKGDYDCIVLDMSLPDMSGIELLESLRNNEDDYSIPIVVYTGKDLEPQERMALDSYANSIIIKDARSPERLLDDTALFLHRVESDLPPAQQRTIRMLHNPELTFTGRKVLLVDDDMRNTFSLSAALQEKKMEVLTADNGVKALEVLDAQPDVAIVLMDIMMPEMDGYEATRRIRDQGRFANLPIIALTAKAMKGDRALCIEAGTNDYLTKPVNTEKLFSMMRVWLYQ
ncbi:MAG: response regulator [Magnetococcales bacterium]|nr:response regulator [Magnetococcales bacterium]